MFLCHTCFCCSLTALFLVLFLSVKELEEFDPYFCHVENLLHSWKIVEFLFWILYFGKEFFIMCKTKGWWWVWEYCDLFNATCCCSLTKQQQTRKACSVITKFAMQKYITMHGGTDFLTSDAKFSKESVKGNSLSEGYREFLPWMEELLYHSGYSSFWNYYRLPQGSYLLPKYKSLGHCFCCCFNKSLQGEDW